MAPQFRNIEVEAGFAEQSGNLRTQAARWDVFLFDRVAQNVAHLFFHAVAIPLGTTLQSRFYPILNVADDKLCHGTPGTKRYHDITRKMMPSPLRLRGVRVLSGFAELLKPM
jgi:hypothetical protein